MSSKHPEYDRSGGQIAYVTYSRATGAFSSEHLVSLERHRLTSKPNDPALFCRAFPSDGNAVKESNAGFRTVLDCLVDRE